MATSFVSSMISGATCKLVDILHNTSRISTQWTNKAPSRVELLQGTLDLLILRTLLAGPSHGHAIAKHIQRTSEELLQVETGSLYPALHRLEAKGWIGASWELSDKGKRARYYRLTAVGRRQLASEQSKWEAFSRAMGLILNPADQEGQ